MAAYIRRLLGKAVHKMNYARATSALLASFVLVVLLMIIQVKVTTEAVSQNGLVQRLDRTSQAYVDESLARAATTFALARALNGLISVIQESAVQATLFGTGVTLAVGQVLDPVNDLVERFSWVLLASLTSLGVQKFIIEVGPWVAIRILGSLALAAFLVAIWLRGSAKYYLYLLGAKLIVAGLAVLILIPLAAYANQQVYTLFLDQEYRQVLHNLDQEKLKTPIVNSEDGWLDQLRKLNLKEKLTFLRDKMADYADDITRLIVIFLIKTILLPIATAWMFLKALRMLAGRTTPYAFEALFRGRRPGGLPPHRHQHPQAKQKPSA